MNSFLKRCFSNNGVARGILYFSNGVLIVLAGAFAAWAKEPPANWYAVAAVFFGALLGGNNALRGFLDQHLSNIKKDDNSKQPKV